MSAQRVCSKCHVSLPETEEYFYKHRRGRGGLRDACKQCFLAQNRAWRAVNKDRWAAYQREYDRGRGAHPRDMEKYDAWMESHKEQVAACIARWHAEHPEAGHASRSRRRARLANASGSHTEEDIRQQYQLQSGRCHWCGIAVDNAYHVDHVVPLARGGSNDPENIVIACPTCNLRKGAKMPDEFVKDLAAAQMAAA